MNNEPRTSTHQIRHKTPALKGPRLTPFCPPPISAASVVRNCRAIASQDVRLALQMRTCKALKPCDANSLRCREMRYTFSGGISSLVRGHVVSILF